MSDSIDWKGIFRSAVSNLEKQLDLDLIIHESVVSEIEANSDKTLQTFNQEVPNAAKVAGNVAFWIKKLKPLSPVPNSTASRDSHVNEIIAVTVGLNVCRTQVEPEHKAKFRPSPRVYTDWAMTLREHSHSPSGLTMMFELLMDSHTTK